MNIEQAIDEFESHCQNQNYPDLKAFVTSREFSSDQQKELLGEVACIDLEYRWRNSKKISELETQRNEVGDTSIAGLPPCPIAEDYFRKWPELQENSSFVIEFIVEEFRARQQWGDRPAVEEYLERFDDLPGLRDSIETARRQMEQESTSQHELHRCADLSDEFEPPVEKQGQFDGRAFDRYQLLETLGQGGMGDVYLAHDTKLDRRVALKMPKLEYASDEVRKRFINEAKAAAVLHHPHLCPVFDSGEFEGQPFLTMAYVKGKTLRDILNSDKLSVDEFVELLTKVARAMQFAHEQGIVHRDLKPANIMIDFRGEPVVMDFGLAFKATDARDERITKTGDTLGSPAYMSPEQIEGKVDSIGHATDVYSLGVILFELITGQLPFTGPVGSLMVCIARDDPPRPSAIADHVNPDLEQLCLQMLEKDPANRPQTMAEVARRLEDPCEGHRRVKPSGKDTSEPPRNRKGSWIAGGFFAALVILAGIIFNIKTPYGDVRVEVPNEYADQINIRVTQDGKLVKIADQSSGWVLNLKEGEYEFKLGSGEEKFEITPQKIDVIRDDEAVVSVSLLTSNNLQETVPDSANDNWNDDTQVTSQAGLALSFDGIDDHVVTPVVYDGSHPITIEAWVAPANDYGTGFIISNDERTSKGFGFGQRFVREHQARKWYASIRDRSKSMPWTESQIDGLDVQQRRLHIAACWNKMHVDLFVNGKQTGSHHRSELSEMPSVNLPFLIGTCYRSLTPSMMTANRFHGVIDEVRISRVSRYESGEFVPEKRFEPDEDTIALYHFDEAEGQTAFDSSSNKNHAKIVGAAHVPAISMDKPSSYAVNAQKFRSEVRRPVLTRSGPALKLDGTGRYARSPQLDLDLTQPFTLETWFTPINSDFRNKQQVIAGIEGISIWSSYEIKAGVKSSTRWVVARSGPPRCIESWKRTHLAMQWTGQKFELFINGRRSPLPVNNWDSGRSEQISDADFIRQSLEQANRKPLIIGSQKNNLSSISVDRVRLSRGIRYVEDFEPVDFGSDENTVLLYDFHESEGDVLHDVSGNGHDAKITGGEWLPTPAENESND